ATRLACDSADVDRARRATNRSAQCSNRPVCHRIAFVNVCSSVRPPAVPPWRAEVCIVDSVWDLPSAQAHDMGIEVKSAKRPPTEHDDEDAYEFLDRGYSKSQSRAARRSITSWISGTRSSQTQATIPEHRASHRTRFSDTPPAVCIADRAWTWNETHCP